MVWVSIELNLLIFLPIVVLNTFVSRGASGLKIFFLQRLGGLFVLIRMILISQKALGAGPHLAGLGLLYKIGGFPFHSWLLQIRMALSWESLLVIVTIQKILPLCLLTIFNRDVLVLVSVVAWGVLRVSALLVKNVKKVFLISSLYFLRALVLATALGGWRWKVLLWLYSCVFASFSVLRGGEKASPSSTPGGVALESLGGWLVVILFLRGLPPLPAFFLKLELFSSFCGQGELFQGLIFMLLRGGFIYIYVTLLSRLVLFRVTLKRRSPKYKTGAIIGLSPILTLWAII